MLVKLVLILFLFSENRSGFWLQGSNCVNGCCEHPVHDTPHGVLLRLEIPVGRSRRFILFSRWTAEFMRQLSAILPPFSCISIKEALVIIVQRHYSPFLQRQLRAIQAKNSIRISQLNHLVSACFAGIISSSLSSSACCLEMHSLLCLRGALTINISIILLFPVFGGPGTKRLHFKLRACLFLTTLE